MFHIPLISRQVALVIRSFARTVVIGDNRQENLNQRLSDKIYHLTVGTFRAPSPTHEISHGSYTP